MGPHRGAASGGGRVDRWSSSLRSPRKVGSAFHATAGGGARNRGDGPLVADEGIGQLGKGPCDLKRISTCHYQRYDGFDLGGLRWQMMSGRPR